MDLFTEIQDRLETKKFLKTAQTFHDGASFETDDGIIFVKTNYEDIALDMLNGEFSSLQKIAETQTICTPKPYFVIADPNSNGGALIVEYLNMQPVTNWKKLGSNLADLHLFNSVLGRKKLRLESWIGKPLTSQLPENIEFTINKNIKLNIPCDIIEKVDHVEEFGFYSTTCCGKIPQNNEWHDNWIEFYARNRLKQQVDLVIENFGNRKIIEYWSELQLKIDKFFIDVIDNIEPALLHGDLWSGNVTQIVNGDPVIFDPASFYGHSEYELSISKLFGGFSSIFYDEYFNKIPQQKGFKKRSELYTLFHLLNHWNHFGGSYANQSIDLMKKITSYVFNIN
ncbi:ketosamine-3-kinase isoform X2 [Dermatophagoides farinae]|uniref:protein-ribulosamine 3-kinase n=1 Tax=Dermatophagoides farinae TaxID=6954 RepID=A0A922L2G1_DERFA|nr:ketosamine-3-kinase-like isoform X2 [Dermatophagoides farinae]KAH9516058.1 fructosamine 3 kinase, variant 2 [Dermatophagoides farinae]